MKLIDFIKKLNHIAEEYGGDAEVIMADELPVVDPVFSDKYSVGKSVVITDQ
ncbi:MAG: hypothetical protein HYT31_01645 [Parcubacteria group bacterium]|nr:hypothetical protein [Parcubacteria group bacterium]